MQPGLKRIHRMHHWPTLFIDIHIYIFKQINTRIHQDASRIKKDSQDAPLAGIALTNMSIYN